MGRIEIIEARLNEFIDHFGEFLQVNVVAFHRKPHASEAESLFSPIQNHNYPLSGTL